MPQTPHGHKHFTGTATVRDIVIGMSDGLTVPFALAAGLSGAVDATSIVITAGLAEVAAGAIAMGLGGYLAAKTDTEHYATERATEERATFEMPEEEAKEVAEVFHSYGLDEATVDRVVTAIRSDQTRLIDFMMKFELGLEKPDPKRAGRSALTIAGSYITGGLIPLSPVLLPSVDPFGPGRFRNRNSACPWSFWLRQRAVYSEESTSQCMANRGRRRAGGYGGICVGKDD